MGNAATLLLCGAGASAILRTDAAPQLNPADPIFFFLGLLSVMDSVLEMPMARVLEDYSGSPGDQGGAAGRSRPLASAVSAHAGAGIRRLAGSEEAGSAVSPER